MSRALQHRGSPRNVERVAESTDTLETTPAAPNPRPGTTLVGRFRLEERIGAGGMSSVYRATDQALGRAVAIKIFRRDAADASDLRREREEIRTIATLDHPAIVTLYDAVADPERATADAFLVMQLIEGESLAQRLSRGPLAEEQPAAIGAAIAGALAYVHARGIIHRDVKPGNILLPGGDSTGPVAMLTDFGIARIVDGARLTATDTVLGTASYLSPEQARGWPLGPASDIYSLGLVLLECLTGVRAYPGSAVESAVARLTSDPDVPDTVAPEWHRLLRAMTAREAGDRPTAAEVASELSGWWAPADAVTVPMRTPVVDEDLPPTTVLPTAGNMDAVTEEQTRSVPVRKKRRAALLLASIAAVVVGGGVAVGLLSSSTPDTPTVEYPAVEGDVGVHLEQLQESVEP